MDRLFIATVKNLCYITQLLRYFNDRIMYVGSLYKEHALLHLRSTWLASSKRRFGAAEVTLKACIAASEIQMVAVTASITWMYLTHDIANIIIHIRSQQWHHFHCSKMQLHNVLSGRLTWPNSVLFSHGQPRLSLVHTCTWCHLWHENPHLLVKTSE